MRVTRIWIKKWRNFRGIEILVSTESSLVCVIGENGAGKSHILELLSSCAHRLGISPDVELDRGDPLSDEHLFSITVHFQKIGVAFATGLVDDDPVKEASEQWDGQIKLTSVRKENGDSKMFLYACGVATHEKAFELANRFVDDLRAKEENFHLYLDANRSYVTKQIQAHIFADGLTRDWDSKIWSKDRSFRPSKTLFDEWLQYILAKDSQSATKHYQLEREALDEGSPRPEFVDEFSDYKASILKVLPHLKFEGVDTRERQVVYDSTGLKLNFSQLSGGEREIAFLIGQIDRFQLKQGLVLVDEPELHLNPDLIRIWVAFLRDSMTDGQVWIATHSLEAVEVAGDVATVVLEKDLDNRSVTRARRLEDARVLSVLSRAVGSPAFAIQRLRFIFIEGEAHSGERERFFRICGEPDVNRFIPAGGCKSVLSKVGAIRELGAESEGGIRVGGIVDRDFRNPLELNQEVAPQHCYALPCHEIENLFLEPVSLQATLDSAGLGANNAADALKRAADRCAGGWILQNAYVASDNLVSPWNELKEHLWNLTWADLEDHAQQLNNAIATADNPLPGGAQQELYDALEASFQQYEDVRDGNSLWRRCMGKQVFGFVSSELGFADANTLETMVVSAWSNETAPLPQAVTSLREYVGAL